MPRRLVCALTAFVALALAALTPAVAPAQRPATIADPAAVEVTALDGTIVWVTATADGRQALMQHRAGVTGPVPGAPAAAAYRSIDLGRDTRNGLVLTYLRCETPSRCAARQDDLAGRRASVPGLAVKGCAPTTAPALWRGRAAYGLSCRKGTRFDAGRSGVYVKSPGRAPRRLARPTGAARAGAALLTAVDVRGTQVAAVAADIWAFAFTQTVNGTGLRSFRVASSEGESDQRARGLALGTTGTLWSLATSTHPDSAPQAVLHRLAGGCQVWEVLTSADAERFPATDVAVDGGTMHLLVPGTGIVAHTFTPGVGC